VKKSWRQFAIFGLFLVAGLIAFSSIINSWFLSDDFAQIGKLLGGDLSVVWGREHGGFFRPLFILSYLIDTTLWGARPFGFHLTNVVFHSLNAFFTFILSLRLVDDLKFAAQTKRMISVGAGALFLLHPSHTEAVSWISGRADVLATFFCLASLLSYLEYARSKRRAQLALSLLCFALGLLAKESAICLPFLILTVGLFKGVARTDRNAWRRFLVCMTIYFSILLAFVAIRSLFIGSLVGGYGVSQHLNFSPAWLRDRLLEASVRSVLPVLPSRLSWFLFKPLQSRVFILFSLTCVGAVAVAIVLRRRWYGPADRKEQNKFLIGLVILFLFSLLPVINLRLTLYQTLGERFLYLPSVFSCLLMTCLAGIFMRNRWLLFSMLICVLGFYSVSLYQTNRSWHAAAQLSRSVMDELVESSTRDHLIIFNVPDNLRGVPVFHNGLPEALLYFQNRKRFRQVEIIAFQDLQSPLDEVALNSRADYIELHLLNDNNSFVRLEPSECFEATAQPHNLHLLANPCAATADLFFFNRGTMLRSWDK